MEVSDDGLTSYIRDEVPGVDTHGYDGYAEIAVPRALGSVRLTVNMPTPDDFCHGVYLRRGHQLEMDLDLGGESSNNATVAGDYCVEPSPRRRGARRASAAPWPTSWPAAKRNFRVWNPRSKRPQSFTLPDEWCGGGGGGCAACNLFLQVYLCRGAQARLQGRAAVAPRQDPAPPSDDPTIPISSRFFERASSQSCQAAARD